MKLMEFNWRPTDRQLRQFACCAAVAAPLLGWLWSRDLAVTGACALVGAACGAIGWLRPRWLKHPFIAANLIAWPIGLVIGEVVLAALYFFVLKVFGLASRCFGGDRQWPRIDTRSES
jgi:hypothetical protein